MPDRSFLLKLYRWVLKLYPVGFRENYASAMEREVRDELDGLNGVRALGAFSVGLLIDLAGSIPLQISREVAQDTRHTLRLWARRPWHTAFAAGTLAIGIGANLAVFSVLNGLLLRSLPFHEPERLALLRHQEFLPPHDSAKQFHDWRSESAFISDAALVDEYDANLNGNPGAARVHAAHTSWNFFLTLGAQMALGRGFEPEEDTAGRNDIAVIGYGLWQQLFAGDPRAIGSTIRIDGESLRIIGVAPSGFEYPGGAVLWRPAAFSPGNNGWNTIARLKPGLEWEQAQSAFAAEVNRLSSKTGPFDNANPPPRLKSLQESLAGSAKDASLLLMAAVALILLIACANVANLLMARVADRAAELALRSALGASVARLRQQMLTESLLLSMLGTLAGLLTAFWVTSIAARVLPPPLSSQSYTLLNGPVLAFAALIWIVSGLLFGVLPSVYAGRIRAFGTRNFTDVRNSRWIREALAAGQVMLVIVFLSAAISIGRAFVRLIDNDRGYEVKGIVTANVSLDGTKYQMEKRQLAYFAEALARIRRLTGIRSASATEFLPLYANVFVGGPFGLEGRPAARNSMMISVLPGYFRTMGAQIRCGREFTEEEAQGGANVAVVNERFAAGFGPPEHALGRRLTAGRNSWQIVGVVKGMNYETDPTVANGNQVFLPSKSPGSFFSTFVARVNGRAEDHLAEVRDAIRSVDPQIPVFGVKTMEQRLNEVFARPRFYRTALWTFTAFGLLLSVVGIYAMTSYAVVQRSQEIGVRLALGTTPAGLRRTLLGQGVLMVMAGAIPGIAVARLTGAFLERLIEGATVINPGTSAGLILFLTLVASTSIWSATRRIAALDVMTILRAQ